MGRPVFIVSRDKVWLFDYLIERFAEDPNVTVLHDRRVGEQRQKHVPHHIERRRGERRTRASADAEEFARQGFLIIEL